MYSQKRLFSRYSFEDLLEKVQMSRLELHAVLHTLPVLEWKGGEYYIYFIATGWFWVRQEDGFRFKMLAQVYNFMYNFIKVKKRKILQVKGSLRRCRSPAFLFSEVPKLLDNTCETRWRNICNFQQTLFLMDIDNPQDRDHVGAASIFRWKRRGLFMVEIFTSSAYIDTAQSYGMELGRWLM